MDSGNWTLVIVELIRAFTKLVVVKMRKSRRDEDGGSGRPAT